MVEGLTALEGKERYSEKAYSDVLTSSPYHAFRALSNHQLRLTDIENNQNTSSTLKMSAARAVFDTYELLEMVLVQLPMRDILIARAVCTL